MKINTLGNLFKESIKNSVRHPLVTIASITTVALMLLILGVFTIFSMNITQILDRAGQQPTVEIYADYDITEPQLQAIWQRLQSSENVKNAEMRSPKQNLEIFRETLGDKASVLDRLKADRLPYSFIVQLKDPSLLDNFRVEISSQQGVRDVRYAGELLNFFAKAQNSVNIAFIIAFVALALIAMFIISNMVRVSVLARREEVQIMKYIGATTLYIRIPYVFEGALVGCIGSFISSIMVYFIYASVYHKLMNGVDVNSYYALIDVAAAFWPSALICLVFGVLIGSIGSAISVRRYVQV